MHLKFIPILFSILFIGYSTATPTITNTKPTETSINTAVQLAYNRALENNEGKNADYIPALANVDRHLFSISIVTTQGQIINKGDTKTAFPLESISKIFTLAVALQDNSPQDIFEKIGTNASGLSFNSVLAIELNQATTPAMNPLVNAGAIATTSLIKGQTADEKFNRLLTFMSTLAGHPLTLNKEVYQSEAETNTHNQAIAMLLKSYDKLYDDPQIATEAYTKACSVNVTSQELAIMGAVLANNGINPITQQRLLSEENVAHILAMMTTAGLYENSGSWLYWTGLPAKSGVSGGILAIVPGKMSIVVYSPPIDKAGNSVRGQQVITDLSKLLHLNIFNNH